MYSHPLTCT